MHDDDDDDKASNTQGKGGLRIKDWDCPECNANNPSDETLPDGRTLEFRCHYCGREFLVSRSDGGKLRFKEI